ncbi:MAG: hypothetical protein LUF92_07165 [Clostridiales bacterium]|nr:hypothetical protein [Clostridiales bacterium]
MENNIENKEWRQFTPGVDLDDSCVLMEESESNARRFLTAELEPEDTRLSTTELETEDVRMLTSVSDFLWKNAPKTTVINSVRYQEMRSAKAALDQILKESDRERSKIQFLPAFCGASLNAEFDTLFVFDMKRFQYIIRKADNFEIYPLTNGKVRMSFMFNKALIPIG